MKQSLSLIIIGFYFFTPISNAQIGQLTCFDKFIKEAYILDGKINDYVNSRNYSKRTCRQLLLEIDRLIEIIDYCPQVKSTTRQNQELRARIRIYQNALKGFHKHHDQHCEFYPGHIEVYGLVFADLSNFDIIQRSFKRIFKDSKIILGSIKIMEGKVDTVEIQTRKAEKAAIGAERVSNENQDSIRKTLDVTKETRTNTKEILKKLKQTTRYISFGLENGSTSRSTILQAISFGYESLYNEKNIGWGIAARIYTSKNLEPSLSGYSGSVYFTWAGQMPSDLGSDNRYTIHFGLESGKIPTKIRRRSGFILGVSGFVFESKIGLGITYSSLGNKFGARLLLKLE